MYDFRDRVIIRLEFGDQGVLQSFCSVCGEYKILRSIDDVNEMLEKLLLIDFTSDSLLRHLPPEFELRLFTRILGHCAW